MGIKIPALSDECELCGRKNGDHGIELTRHRLDPGRNGGSYTRNNVVVLCGGCHFAAEKGFPTPKALRAIIDYREKEFRIANMFPGLSNGLDDDDDDPPFAPGYGPMPSE
jgi:hypothetical protein